MYSLYNTDFEIFVCEHFNLIYPKKTQKLDRSPLHIIFSPLFTAVCRSFSLLLLKLMLWPTFQMFGRAKNKVAQEENINKQKEEEGTSSF